MGLFDKLKDNSKSKLGMYSLEDDKIEIIKIKDMLDDSEECMSLLNVIAFNNSWVIATTNIRLILVRKKFNKELEIKTFNIEEIEDVEVQKGTFLTNMSLKIGSENISFNNMASAYIDGFISALNKETVYKPKELSKRQAEKKYQKDRVAQLKRDKIPFCTKCKSTSLTYQNKKLSVGRAITGGVLLGPGGAVLGGLSSKKGYAKCLNCGHKWKL